MENKAFCQLKWDDTILNLQTNSISSCCRSISHQIDYANSTSNPVNLLNTKQLISDRQQMLDGIRPDSCSHCWQLEDKKQISPRNLFSSGNLVNTENYSNPIVNKFPKTIELALNNLCNLTCLYCCHRQSSAWYSDIKKNGQYFDEPRFKIYPHDTESFSKSISDLNNSNINILINNWICADVFSDVEKLTLSGGEPLLVSTLGEFVNNILDKYPTIKIVINTGLGVTNKQFSTFIDLVRPRDNIIMSLSQETTGKLSEMVRYGVFWEKWVTYAEELANRGFKIKFQSTISSVTIFGFVDFLLWKNNNKVLKDSRHLAHHVMVPEFLQVATLGKENIIDELNNLLLLKDKQGAPVYAFIKDLCQITNPVNIKNIELLRKYITMFADRRNININNTLPAQLLRILR